jgi:hypothetical protein
MLYKTVHNFKGLGSGRPSLVQSESVEPLKDGLYVVLSKNFLYKFPYVAFSRKTSSAETGLTYSTLPGLLRCQSESGKNLHKKFYDNVGHGCSKRDRCIEVKSAEEVFDGLEQVDEGIIACADVLCGLVH